MGILKQLAQYLFLKKKDVNEPSNTQIKAMHWMNRTSLLIFIVALCIIAYKFFFKH